MCSRTIRRDLNALQSAGFPLYTEAEAGREHYWRLSARPFRRLDGTAFTLSELCAFYANRTRLAAMGASPIDADLQSALDKIGRALSPHMKTYLERLSAVVTCKPGARGRGDSRAQAAQIDTLVRATIDHRRIEMDYHSFASRRVKKYVIEPHRLTFTNGSLYLYAFVPAYGQMRTFALQRIRRLKTLDETFNPVAVTEDPYGASLGVFTGGRPQRVEIAFASPVAPYVEEREWHASQQVTRRDDGSIVLRMDVAVDVPLRTWVLGFGHHARVLKPSSLATEILEELEEAREQYALQMPLEFAEALHDPSRQPHLPFGLVPARAGSVGGAIGRSARHG